MNYKSKYEKYKRKYLNLKKLNSICKLNNVHCEYIPDINNSYVKCIDNQEKCNKEGIFKTFGIININVRLNPIL